MYFLNNINKTFNPKFILQTVKNIYVGFVRYVYIFVTNHNIYR